MAVPQTVGIRAEKGPNAVEIILVSGISFYKNDLDAVKL